jgi:hypothetical protein
MKLKYKQTKQKIRKVIDTIYREKNNLYLLLSEEGIKISPKAEDAINDYFDRVYLSLEKTLTEDVIDSINNLIEALESVDLTPLEKIRDSFGDELYE